MTASVFRWLACLPVAVLAKLITIICAPLTAWLSLGRDALPVWLRWMQTHDNSIDALWQQPDHMRGYATLLGVQPSWCAFAPLLQWYCRMLWLIRNPAYSLMDKLGLPAPTQHARTVTQRGQWDSGSGNWQVQIWPDTHAWQVKAQLFYTRARYVRIYIGYKQPPGTLRLMYCCHFNPMRKKRY